MGLSPPVAVLAPGAVSFDSSRFVFAMEAVRLSTVDILFVCSELNDTVLLVSLKVERWSGAFEKRVEVVV